MNLRETDDNKTMNICEILGEIDDQIWKPIGLIEFDCFYSIANFFKAKNMIFEDTYEVLRTIAAIGMVRSEASDDESDGIAYEMKHNNKVISHKDLAEFPEMLATYLRHDERLNSYLGEIGCFAYLLEQTKKYNVDACYKEINTIANQFLTIGNQAWGIIEHNFFDEDVKDALFYQDLASIDCDLFNDNKTIICKGKGARLLGTSSGHIFCYFIFERNKRCLHINLKSQKIEEFYGIAPFGIIEDTFLVYFNESGMISYYDTRTEQNHDICTQEYGRYRANGNYIVVIPKSAEPYKLYLSGLREECDFKIKKEILLERLFDFSVKVVVNHNNVMDYLKLHEMISYKITINCLTEIMRFIESNQQYIEPIEKKRLNTLKKVLNLLESAGVDRELNIFEEMWTLCKYHSICIYNNEKNRPFSPIFYKILYMHSKEDDFLEKLRTNPEKLFEKDIQYAKRKAASKKEESW